MAAAALPVMVGLSAASTASSFIGQRRAAGAAKQQGSYEAAIANQNAALADAQAEDAIARGREAEMKSHRGTKLLHGSQRAALAASGVNIDSGSARDVQVNDQAQGALDEVAIRNNARREAWGFKTQASQYRSQAGLALLGAKNTAASYRNASTGTLISGAAEMYGTYKKYK